MNNSDTFNARFGKATNIAIQLQTDTGQLVGIDLDLTDKDALALAPQEALLEIARVLSGTETLLVLATNGAGQVKH